MSYESQTLNPSQKFILPQMLTSSQQINQANSDRLQNLPANTPTDNTASSDIYSGAKLGIDKIKSGILEQTGGADAVDGDLQTSRQLQDKANTPDSQVGKPQTGIQTGIQSDDTLNAGDKYYKQAGDIIKNATSPQNNPYMQKLEKATDIQNQAEQAYGQYDPTKQPVSKLRKAAGIATGVLTGLTGGGPIGGVNAYHQITRAPAMEAQAALKRQADAASIAQAAADKQAEAARQFSATDVANADAATKAGLAVTATQQFNLEEPERQAVNQKNLDEAAKAKAEALAVPANTQAHTIEANKPTVTTSQPGEHVNVTKPDSNGQWNTSSVTGNGVIGKLGSKEEMIGIGAAKSAGLEPNDLMNKYYNGDDGAAQFIRDANDKWDKSHNATLALGAPIDIKEFFDKSGAPHLAQVDTRTGAMSVPNTGGKVPFEMPDGATLGSNAKPLSTGNQSAYKYAPLAVATAPEVIKEIGDMKDELGRFSGTWNDFLTSDVGADNPKFAALKTDLENLNLYFTGTHVSSYRSPALLQKFQTVMGGPANHPDVLIANIKSLAASSQKVKDIIEKQEPNAAEVRAQKESEGASSVPATHKFSVDYNGKSYNFDSQDKLDKFKTQFGIK